MTIGPTPIRIFLDVDGCLNAWWADMVWPTKDYGVANGYKIIHSPEMVEALDKFVADTGAQIVWTTTWCADAATKLAPVISLQSGLPEASTVLMPLSGEISFPSILWKRDSIRALLAENPGPFVHIDDENDDAGFGIPDNGKWLKEAEALGGFAIAPDQRTGITPFHIERMYEYAASLTSKADEDEVE